MPKYKVTVAVVSHEDIEVEVEEGPDAQHWAETEADEQAWRDASSPTRIDIVSSVLIP